MTRPLTIALLGIMLSGCTQRTDTAVPRRPAYPRVYAYDSVYTTVDSLPLSIKANAECATQLSHKPDGTVWLNVLYPHYGATIYCTFTPVGPNDVEQVIDNRTERIHLNLGGARPETQEFTTPSGYYADIISAPSVYTTPIQFIAVNRKNPRWVISGAVFFDCAKPITSADSVAPMVAVMHRDVEAMIQSLAD